ncbi:hypothetical protein EC991_002837 [Linnemannia zychae]|nr:hypothetical protein EC991_002837 [Linnemannia zychae]
MVLPDDWVLLDNMEDIAVGMGLVPATNTEIPADPPQQQKIQTLAHEQLLREQQGQVRACKAHVLELHEKQREQAVASGTTPNVNHWKGKNPAQKRKSTDRDQQVQQRDYVISITQSQQAVHLEHTMQGELSMMHAGMDCLTAQAKSTRDIYARYQSHWTKWCERRGFNDDYENTAESPDPEKGIELIRTKPRCMSKRKKRNKFKKSKRSQTDVSVGDMDLSDDTINDLDCDNEDEDDDNDDVYDPNGALPSFATLDMYIKAAVDLQSIQKTIPKKA